MTKLPLNPKTEIFRWGPAPGKFYYESDFIDAIFEVYPRLFKNFTWPRTLFLAQKERIFFIDEFPAIRAAGKKVFIQYILPKKSRIDLKNQWHIVLTRLHDLENKFDRTNLKKLLDVQLYELGSNIYNTLIDFWIPTVPAELGNYGADDLLKSELTRLIPEGELHKVMEILTSPTELSFYQQEEIDLAKTNNIKKHQQKYFWLKNSYNGAQVLPVKFFANRKNSLAPNLVKTARAKLFTNKERKQEVEVYYKLPKSIMRIAEALTFAVNWQDDRKKEIFKYLHYKELFLREVARRRGFNVNQALNLGTREVVAAVKSKRTKTIINRRKSGFVFVCDTFRIKELNSKTASHYWKIYEHETIKDFKGDIRGIVAAPSLKKIKGRIRIVLNPLKNNQFKKGEILVAPMTSPEYIFLMKKAVAIITDAGGLTSHAAIVSRELGLPCIVGTKVATRLLKDGDMVEVDANKGIVRKI